MNASNSGLRLRIYLGESDTWEHRPLYEAIVVKAREAALAGATVFRSPMGFGVNSRIHTAKVLNLSTDLPVVVEMIDTEAKIRRFLDAVTPMIQGGVATVEEVEIVRFGGAA